MKKEKPIKMFLVKREVMARSIREAMHKDGEIYAIEVALDQPDTKLNCGFDKHNDPKS